MNRPSINCTLENGLCCGCGVCKGICPQDCISWKKENGLYLPLIDEKQCVSCGLCTDVCPGLGHPFEPADTAAGAVTGTVLTCCNAWSKDPDTRYVGASGGVVSTMIRELLAAERYDGVFCLDSYDYRNRLLTRLYKAEEIMDQWNVSNSAKSRYLPVSHEEAVRYMKKNRDAKLILIGTSCAIRGLIAAMEKLHLNREQYLCLGLFCDQVFNFNVLSYFRDIYASQKEIQALHFKNKESGGWPGDMKFFPKNGEPFFVPLSERTKAKPYFMPERCLYCVDKLNVCADISLGDNYTGKDGSRLGSNSVIIRTQTGMAAWDAVRAMIEIREIDIYSIQKAQYLEGRLNNLYYADIKTDKLQRKLDLNPGVCREQDYRLFISSWTEKRGRLTAGAVYDVNPKRIQKQIQKDAKDTNPVFRLVRRALSYIMRKLK